METGPITAVEVQPDGTETVHRAPRPGALTVDEIARRFVYHPPTEATRKVHDAIRGEEIKHALALIELLPGESREKSLCITALEEASFWAHAHVARNLP